MGCVKERNVRAKTPIDKLHYGVGAEHPPESPIIDENPQQPQEKAAQVFVFDRCR
jgi:hypothetical protein